MPLKQKESLKIRAENHRLLTPQPPYLPPKHWASKFYLSGTTEGVKGQSITPVKLCPSAPCAQMVRQHRHCSFALRPSSGGFLSPHLLLPRPEKLPEATEAAHPAPSRRMSVLSLVWKSPLAPWPVISQHGQAPKGIFSRSSWRKDDARDLARGEGRASETSVALPHPQKKKIIARMLKLGLEIRSAVLLPQAQHKREPEKLVREQTVQRQKWGR